MPLTPEEKACGRVFRDWCQNAILDGVTADAFCPPYIIWYRHECKPSDKAVQSGTWAMRLKQTYCLSPAYSVFREGEVRALSWDRETYSHAAEVWADLEEADMTHLSVVKALIPAGKFAYIFRFGECPRCFLRVRSGTARFVLAAENPPEKGANIAKQPPHGSVPADKADAAQPS